MALPGETKIITVEPIRRTTPAPLPEPTPEKTPEPTPEPKPTKEPVPA